MGLLNIFPKIVGIGDSLLSGCEVTKNIDYIDSPKYSWLKYLCDRNHIEYISLTRGGQTAKSWIDIYSYFLNEISSPCYFIGLGANDRDNFELGSIEDTIEKGTFIGYYKEIINIIKHHNPYAYIFCLSSYYKDNVPISRYNTYSSDYSKAIKDICDLYKQVYFVDFVNNSKYAMVDSGYDFTHHYNTIGYYLISQDIENLCDKIINDNIEDFKKAGLYDSFGAKYKNIKQNF